MPVTKQPRVRMPVALLDIGDSFFVPTLDYKVYDKEIQELAELAGYDVVFTVGIDKALGCFGIRVYRIK